MEPFIFANIYSHFAICVDCFKKSQINTNQFLKSNFWLQFLCRFHTNSIFFIQVAAGEIKRNFSVFNQQLTGKEMVSLVRCQSQAP